MEYIIFCDESVQKGDKFCDFFGGCMVSSKDINDINNAINNKRQELNLTSEMKWVKVTDNYLDKYKSIIDLFFEYIKLGKIKMRVMFRKKEDCPSAPQDADYRYFKLYYQFLKHAFGLRYIPNNEDTYVRFYLDKLPDKKIKVDEFKSFIVDLPKRTEFRESGLRIRKSDITEIISHQHVLLQCVDIVLGAMYFRLNDMHLVIQPGQQTRGKRTIAKDELSMHILNHIKDIHKNFEISKSTPNYGKNMSHLESPYEHWRFIPK